MKAISKKLTVALCAATLLQAPAPVQANIADWFKSNHTHTTKIGTYIHNLWHSKENKIANFIHEARNTLAEVKAIRTQILEIVSLLAPSQREKIIGLNNTLNDYSEKASQTLEITEEKIDQMDELKENINNMIPGMLLPAEEPAPTETPTKPTTDEL